ncbi:MAG TPA: hypothetical protein PK637_09385, partial [Flavobacteriales bacterium]|nr:hypothetical protein [Flavobacteriales bacterium]
MKRAIYSAILLCGLLCVTSAIPKSGGPPGCHAGEPPTSLNCTACHTDNPLNSGTANIMFDLGGADTGYVPGNTYTITVAVEKPGMLAAGFQFIALQNTNLNFSPGTISISDPARTQTVDPGNPHVQGCNLLQKVWVEHTYQGINSDANGESRWSFQWQAPATDVGDITFYLATLESDYNGDETGDFVYTQSVLSPGQNTSTSTVSSPENLILFINPLTSKLHIKCECREIKKIEIRNISGTIVKRIDNIF